MSTTCLFLMTHFLPYSVFCMSLAWMLLSLHDTEELDARERLIVVESTCQETKNGSYWLLDSFTWHVSSILSSLFYTINASFIHVQSQFLPDVFSVYVCVVLGTIIPLSSPPLMLFIFVCTFHVHVNRLCDGYLFSLSSINQSYLLYPIFPCLVSFLFYR